MDFRDLLKFRESISILKSINDKQKSGNIFRKKIRLNAEEAYML